ncbi:hypothetical protein [Paraburkholderia unamae]|uniref:Uncharacterized protein n=1 Tax=Paraburkholderia unamae TaxID=219649 RepID=A0ABX5KIG3_9BURK|nr:hypothetical protein [Paraburkholderia unamae]PVX77201.1 hypothetical protein C7402_115260 [Paraburkholderia unamae]
MNHLSYSIVVLAAAYMEFTFVPWLGKNVYRRTVSYDAVIWC